MLTHHELQYFIYYYKGGENVVRQRTKQPGTISTHPKRRANPPQSSRSNTAVSSKKRTSVQANSIISKITQTNLGNISGQLHTVADHLGTFSQVADLMKQYDGQGINLMNLVKNGNSLNHLVKAFLPVFGAGVLGKEEKK